MSQPISEVVIIYNPNSTGNGKANATSLQADLRRLAPTLHVSLKQTEYAGHAEKIAWDYAKNAQRVLLVSSSGDGGYHELINGIVSSGATNIVAGLLPSGNANDHFRAVHEEDVVQRIIAGKSRWLDSISIRAQVEGKPWQRYAHSYAGIGLSPSVGRRLTKAKLNFFNEKWILLRQLFRYRYVAILIDGKERRFSSVVFSNIARMSKVLQVANDSSLTDGKFEISAVTRQSKFRLFLYLFKAATIGLEENSSVSRFEFQTIKPTLIQLDGEVYTLDGSCKVTVESVHLALEAII